MVAAAGERRAGPGLLVGCGRSGRGLPAPGRRHPRRLLHPPARAGRHAGGGLMDPLASGKEYRQQTTGAGRTLTVAPPPPVPVTAPTRPEGPDDDLDPTGELDLTALADAAARAVEEAVEPIDAAEADDPDGLPGM